MSERSNTSPAQEKREWKRRVAQTTIEAFAVVGLAAVLAAVANGPTGVTAQPASNTNDRIVLTGTVRDFTRQPPDFGMIDPLDLGKYSLSIAPSLSAPCRVGSCCDVDPFVCRVDEVLV